MTKRKQIHGDDRRRLMSYVAVTDSCWNWTGRVANSGYGQMSVGGRANLKMKYAHRLSYEMNVGDIPEGMFVCHTCDNKLCVNPSHLFIGTPKENTADGMKKGRIKRVKSSKLKEPQVLDIYASQEPHVLIAKKYGVSETIVREIRNGRKWWHLTGAPRGLG